MAKNPAELPPEVARAFVEDMRRYFAEDNPIKADEIAVLQMHALQRYWKGKLRLNDVKQMFEEMRAHLHPAVTPRRPARSRTRKARS